VHLRGDAPDGFFQKPERHLPRKSEASFRPRSFSSFVVVVVVVSLARDVRVDGRFGRFGRLARSRCARRSVRAARPSARSLGVCSVGFTSYSVLGTIHYVCFVHTVLQIHPISSDHMIVLTIHSTYVYIGFVSTIV